MAIGSSGSGVNDLNPERAYDVDARRLDKTERKIDRVSDAGGDRIQNRVGKFLRSARSAGKFQQKRQIDAPWTNREGQVPAFTEGDQFGRAGSTNYADRPQPSTSKLYY
jgi:hypothetical protein